MRETLVFGMPWLLSAIGCLMIWKVGSFKTYGWLIGIAAQGLWLAWILLAEQYGFLPQNIALTVIYTRNYLAWKKSGLEPIKR